MRRILVGIMLCVVGFIGVGCGKHQNPNIYATLEVYTDNITDYSKRQAIREIENELSGIMLVDFNNLTEEKIEALCDSVLFKWNIEPSLRVIVKSDERCILIFIGGAKEKVVSREIMLPLV